MLYIQESLAPGEKILKFTQYHWLYVAATCVGALFFLALAAAILYVGVIYHYYDIMKVPPWDIFKAGSELAVGDYIKAFWHTNILYRVAAFVLVLMAIIQVGARILVRMTTEMGVTTRRVVFKRGLISRRVEEMRVDFIDGADVAQTIMGRIFNYGSIKMYGTGVEGIDFPMLMEDPVNFRRAVLAARAVTVAGAPEPQQSPLTNSQHHGDKAQSHADQPATETLSDHDRPKAEMPIKPSGPSVSADELKGISAPTDEEPAAPAIPAARQVMRHDV